MAADPDAQLLVDTLVWYGTDYTYGDPRLLSPVNVEILLGGWMPRKLMADTRTLATLPDVLAAYVRFAHRRAGVADRLTKATEDAIRAHTPGYLAQIGKPRRAGAEALLERIGVVGRQEAEDRESEEAVDYGAIRADIGAAEVGGVEQLARLDAVPLPVEELDLTGVPDDVHDRVRRISALCDDCCEALFGLETRTAVRRLLHDVAAGDPMIFRRRSRDDTAAAALCWLVAGANDMLGQFGRVQSQDLMAHFGLTGSPSGRAVPMRAAIGRHPYENAGLGSPRYLTGTHRERLVRWRDDH